MKKFLTLTFLSIFALTACSPAQTEVIAFTGFVSSQSELFHDFGNIDIEGGLIEHTFEFTNDSDEDLVIMNLSTSCGCTAAEVLLSDGTNSPTFGMHDSTQWNQTVPAGEDFDVRVIYDPMAHGPNATGEMNRSVIMVTSSSENGRTAVLDPSTGYAFTQMNIKGLVLSTEDFLEANSGNDEV